MDSLLSFSMLPVSVFLALRVKAEGSDLKKVRRDP